jgi:Yip1 domain.
MSSTDIQPTAAPVVGLTQLQRVTNVFTAPSKTFEDIKHGNRSWWLPFLLFVAIGTGLWAVVNANVSWETVRDNALRMSPKQAERLNSLPPDQLQLQLERAAAGQKIFWAIAPLGVLLMDLIAAGVLLGTINFVFGGRATFGSVLAVIWYAGLPGLIKLILGGIGLFAGVAPESFLPANPAGTNLGYFLSPIDTNLFLYTLATGIDVITIWCLVLTSIGIAIVAGTKRGSGFLAVFGWWAIMIIISSGVALLSS